MIQLPYEQIIARIKEKSQLSDEEIEQKIQDKMEQLSGLISKEGAANIIANQLGVSLVQEGPLKIMQLNPGMKDIEISGKVIRKYNVYEFTRGDTVGKVASFQLADETGQVRVTLWHEQTNHFESLNENDVVKIKDAYVRENNGYKEIHLNDRSSLQINPEGVQVGDVATRKPNARKKIAELTETDANIELLGTIVQVFDLKFYMPKNKPDQTNPSYLLTFFLDDGSENIRVVMFNDQVRSVLKKEDHELQQFKDAPELFTPLKNNLLGEMVKVGGRVNKNEMFDRLEFVANSVDAQVDPEEEIKRALEEQK